MITKIKAYWNSKYSSKEESAIKIQKFLIKLHDKQGESFLKWYKKSTTKEDALKKVIDIEKLDDICSVIREKNIFVDQGYRGSLWTFNKALDQEISISWNIGSTNPQIKNNFLIKIYTDIGTIDTKLIDDVMLLVKDIFKPEQIVFDEK